MDDGIKVVFFRIALIAGAVLFSCLGIPPQYGVFMAIWLIMTWLILRSYDDWGTFLKRCMLAVSFVVLYELSFYMFFPLDLFDYCASGVLLFILLLVNIPRAFLWPHYFTSTLIIAALELINHKHPYSFTFVVFFFASYLAIMNRKQKRYIPVLIKSSIPGALAVLLTWVFTTSNSFMDLYKVSSETSKSFCFLLGFCFFVVFSYFARKFSKANDLFKKGQIFSFDPMPVRRNKNTGNKMEELQSQLNDAYLKECEKQQHNHEIVKNRKENQ